MSNMKELPKTYEPKETEDKLYSFWLENNLFDAEVDPNKQPYCIVIPPPNVTGQLHMGHAFDNTLQDILIRLKRMQGYAALWMPGTDHAGIATQIKVEEALRAQGISRFDLGRDAFLDKVWQWKEKYGSTIIHQLQKLGASCDWRRLRFTMDEGCSKAVREVFVNMYKKGLIYRGYRIINWCPDCTTALSDTEVEYKEQPGHLWHIKYPIEGSDDYITIATTRPETMMGDTGIAVHPEDERYTHLIGKRAILPIINRPIPIFADDYVDPEFGTGCVKVTPCHDPNDFEMGKRHDLEFVMVLDDKAVVNKNGGKYCGMERMQCRKAIISDLEEQGFLLKTEEHIHNVGTCYRCGTTVEPITSDQWFVNMEPLAKDALKVVNDGDIRFVPDRFSKTYTNWMENVHDWCISRQLWWGHRIPAWYCEDCGHITVAKEDPTACEKCSCASIKQEEDVLDTWFSSALWPFSTLGWPDKTPELDYFYPTATLVTGYDIIFFWVARMIFSGMEHMGEKPFSDVFIHGIIRDDKGRKMSKSLGNGIDPLEIIDSYGTDALRLTLVSGIGPGNDARFYNERVESSRNFCNKIWNASRFLMMNMTADDLSLPTADKLAREDKWILTKYNRLISEVTENLEKYELGIAAEKLYSFIWDSFCDWYIELCKARLTGDDAEASRCAQSVLLHVLRGTLELLHPIMPFITESIWQALPHEGLSIMTAKWPTADSSLIFPTEERETEDIMEVIRAVRSRRSDMNVPPSRKADMIIATPDNAELYESARPFLTRLAWASEITVQQAPPAQLDGMVSLVAGTAQIFMPLSDLVDMEAERARLEKELANAKSQADRISGKLSNESFVQKAPEQVVSAEKEKLARFEQQIAKLMDSIAMLG